jgi:hypothetical protein
MAKMKDTDSVDDNHGLVLGGCLPLTWRVIDSLPNAADLEQQSSANLDTLRFLSLLDTPLGESGDETPDGKSQTITRLDFKLNLLLELVGQLFVQQRVIPEARQLTLTSKNLNWQDDEKLTIGNLLHIELYCSLKYPRPLQLYGRVDNIIAQPMGWRIQMIFQALGEALEEALESFIFVHHRRTIAQRRRQPMSSLSDLRRHQSVFTI